MKNLCVMLVPILIFAQTSEEIVKNIDVKKEIEDFIEARGGAIFPSYKAYSYMKIYRTCGCLSPALKPYFYEYLKRIKMENNSQPEWYTQIFYEILHSTHIAIGEVVKLEIDIGGYCGERLPLPSRIWVRILQTFKGRFKKDTVPVWVYTGLEEGIISSVPTYQMGFVGDTLLLFLRDLFPLCHDYAEKYGEDVSYPSGEFFPASGNATYLLWCKSRNKRRLISFGGSLDLPYENVEKILNFWIPVCEKLEEEAKKYKFPLTEKEYAEFMKKRGYNYPLTKEDFEKIYNKFKKWEEK